MYSIEYKRMDEHPENSNGNYGGKCLMSLIECVFQFPANVG